MSKYHSRKVTVDGITFDSKAEAKRYGELMEMQRQGKIQDLQRQVVFVLLPAQYWAGKCAERAVKYKADFVYLEDGNTVVEDVKGAKTKEYILKRKLMLYQHGIKIKEVKVK